MSSLVAPDGVKLVYELVGDGPPLILHLGAGCDSHLWSAAGYLGPLSRDYRCILFDHRGHGESDHPRGAEANHLDRFVADVIALLDHLGLARAAFWGYSNGVTVGLKVADDHPHRIRALVGSGGVGRLPPGFLTERRPIRMAEFREQGWEKLIDRFEQQEPAGVPPWMANRIRETDMQPFIDWLDAMPDWGWDEWEALPRVSTPTLFVVGELEDPEDETGEGAALMSNASRFRVPGEGHIGAFIRSEPVLPEVLTFLGRDAGDD
jgi:pimeloyl-ACP methyl ester carboxylesterase